MRPAHKHRRRLNDDSTSPCTDGVGCGVLRRSIGSRSNAADNRGLVAVLPLDASQAGVSRADLQAFEETIRTVAGDQLKPRGYTVLTGETTLAILADNGVDPEQACESSCALEAARHLTARLFISGSIARTEGEFVAFVRLYEIEAGSQLGSIHVEGSAMRDLRRQFLEQAPEFFARAMRGLPGQGGAGPVINVGGVILADVPVLPARLGEGGAVQLDVDTDVLVAHAEAVEKDARGNETPAAAAKAWEKLHSLKKGNPYREEAASRAALWREYEKKLDAKNSQLAEDSRKLERLLPLATLSTTQKSQLLGSYVATYGADELQRVFKHVPEQSQAEICADLGRQGIGKAVQVDMPFEKGVARSGTVWADRLEMGSAPGQFRIPSCFTRVSVKDVNGNSWEETLDKGSGLQLIQPAFPGLHPYSYSREWHQHYVEHQGRRDRGPALQTAALPFNIVGGLGLLMSSASLVVAAMNPNDRDSPLIFNIGLWGSLGSAALLGVGIPLYVLGEDPGEFRPPESSDAQAP